MALDTTATEADILAKVKTLANRVYTYEVPDADATPAYPYVVVYFGEPVRTGVDHHITSTRNDTLRGYVTVQVISSDVDSANALKNKLKVGLTGYRPVDSGEMVMEGGTGYAFTDSKPTKFFRELGYSYRTNLTWND